MAILTLYKTQADASTHSNPINLPSPSYGSAKQTASTLVNSGRMATGQVKGQKVGGRNMAKVEIVWKFLTATQWKDILTAINSATGATGNGFYVWIRYFDMELGDFITREFYPSDRTASPFRIDPVTKATTAWLDCSLNFIDTGNPTEYTG